MVTRHAANGAKHGRGAPGAALAARGRGLGMLARHGAATTSSAWSLLYTGIEWHLLPPQRTRQRQKG
jgi:hypothetical protein